MTVKNLFIRLDHFTIACDSRFAALAEFFPYDPETKNGFIDEDHARGKMERVWLEAELRLTPRLPATQIAFAAKQRLSSATALVEALIRSGLGRRVDADADELIELAGTEERIQWRIERSESGAKGGKQSVKTRLSSATAQLKLRSSSAQAEKRREEKRRISSLANAREAAPTPPPQLMLVQETPVQTSSEAKPAKKLSRPKAKKRTDAHPDHQRFIASFDELFCKARKGSRPHWNGKTASHVAELLKAHGYDDCLARAKRMFEMFPQWPAENPDMGTLFAYFDKFAPVKPTRSKTGGHVLGAEYDQAYYEEAASEVF